VIGVDAPGGDLQDLPVRGRKSRHGFLSFAGARLHGCRGKRQAVELQRVGKKRFIAPRGNVGENPGYVRDELGRESASPPAQGLKEILKFGRVGSQNFHFTP